MRSRRIYAHWMDPDYLGKRIFSGDLLKERRDKFEGILKLHALLGDCICISDVQLIETSLLLLMFADAGFRAFITTHPDFIELVARPTDKFGARWDRLKVVGSGMARIIGFGDNYIPNTFESAATMKHVARMFENTKSQSDAEQLLRPGGKLKEFVAGYAEVDRTLVVGLYYALAHFLTDTRAPVLPRESGKSTSYYVELESAYDSTTEEQLELRRLLTTTMALAKTEAEQFKRILILQKLPDVATIGHPDLVKYLTIMQAWNVAVGRTIGADQDSAYCFRGVFPIPVLSGRVPNCTTFVTAQEDEVFASSSQYDWAPAMLGWGVLAEIRTACRSQIDRFQNSLAGAGSDAEGGRPDVVGVNLK